MATRDADQRRAAGGRLHAFLKAAVDASPDIDTVEGLAERAGLPRQTIYRWKSGQSVPTEAKLIQVADALPGMSAVRLLAVYEGREPTAPAPDDLEALLRRVVREELDPALVDELAKVLVPAVAKAVALELPGVLRQLVAEAMEERAGGQEGA